MEGMESMNELTSVLQLVGRISRMRDQEHDDFDAQGREIEEILNALDKSDVLAIRGSRMVWNELSWSRVDWACAVAAAIDRRELVDFAFVIVGFGASSTGFVGTCGPIMRE